MLTLYGLKNCDTCRKAAKALEAAGQSVKFQDVRDTPLSESELAKYLESFGEALLNTRSTTWRGLSAAEREKPVLTLLRDHPTLMKRPVIQSGDTATLGWSKEVQAKYLG